MTASKRMVQSSVAGSSTMVLLVLLASFRFGEPFSFSRGLAPPLTSSFAGTLVIPSVREGSLCESRLHATPDTTSSATEGSAAVTRTDEDEEETTPPNPDNNTPQLLSKFTVGGQEVTSRVVLAPMTRARCTENKDDPYDIVNTLPNDIMAEYYEQRADGNLLITEATAISEAGSGWPNAPGIGTERHAEAWKPVVDRVHAKGSIIYLQLWHMGRQSHTSFHPSTKKIYSASAIPVPTGQAKTIRMENTEWETPEAMTVEEIQETVQDYVRAARNAKAAGFDGVEVHSANGYLIDQFLQTSTNQRTDKYGGSKENRLRFFKEIVEALVADGAYPANRIGFRLSPNGNFGGMGSPDNHEMFPYVAAQMNAYGLSYLHLMDGVGFGFHEKCPVVTAHDIKRHWDGILMANIGLTQEISEGLIRSGAVDMVAFGRFYISNPDLVKRFRNGWPLAADPAYETWWQHTGAKGYTDFPFYKEANKSEKQE